MFPGVVAAPFAIVKVGPDVQKLPPTDAYSGYLPTGRIHGFSMMHESGTGGAPKYGVVSQMPIAGKVTFPVADSSAARATKDTATVGYYKSQLDTGVTVELSATEHAAYYAYTFPADSSKSVVVDVGHVLKSYRGTGWSQAYQSGNFSIQADGHYEGSGTYSGGWNRAPGWTVYFCGIFDTSLSSSSVFEGNNSMVVPPGTSASLQETSSLGGIFSFDATEVTSRVGISFISSEKACKFVHDEIPRGTTMNTLIDQAKQKWNEQVLSKIQITDQDYDVNVQLYSDLYSMHLIPSNRTGENPKWSSEEPYYDDIFTFWDLFRCTTALMHIISPQSYAEQLRSIIDIWRHEGWLPDARSSNSNGETQGGSNADNILADAYVKGVQGIDWTAAYQAMLTDADATPPNNIDPRAPDSSTQQGRGALPDWLRYGYITPRYSRAVSRGIEYAANDFGLYQVARGLGIHGDEQRFLNRSRNWRNYWNDQQTSLNFTGFLVPRGANGSFQYPYDPLRCGSCYWQDPYYEATPWEYTFASGHHDMAHMVSLTGGSERFVQKLETMFVPNLAPDHGNAQFNGTLINPGNEPSFTTPYLFNYAGRQDLAVKHSRHIARSYYDAGTGGIPGNSDAGAMQSWQLWNMIGLYPMTGQTVFLIGSPWFEHMTIDLGEGKNLTIVADGGDWKNDVYFIQCLRVNGQQWTKAWLEWEDVFEKGGLLEFELGPNVTDWATGDLPPSPAS